MFCTKCGTKNDDSALFCAGCGAKLSAPENNQTPEENVAPNPNEFAFFEQVSENVETPVEEVQPVEPMNQANATQNSFGSGMDAMPTYSANPGQEAVAQKQITQNLEPQPQATNQPKGKFSVKKFIFSTIVILVSIAACAGLFVNTVSMKVNMNAAGVEESEVEKKKGTEILKDGVESISEDAVLGSYDTDDLKNASSLVKTAMWALAIGLAVVAVINLILLTAVRKKVAYVITFLLSIVSLGLSGFFAYAWSFKFLDEMRNMMDTYLSDLLEFYENMEYSIKLSANFEIGFVIIVACQAVAFVASIVLLTCKDKKKEVNNL